MKTVRTTVEQCVKLSIFELRRKGALSSDESDDCLYGDGLEIPLTQTNCYFGGKRWWFICPSCGRRMGILYRTWRGQPFLCRKCHNLTYESSKIRRTILEPIAKRFKIRDKYNLLCSNKGRKGFSKLQLLQIEKLKKKISRLPELPQIGKT